jgi:aryl-alcohol dehydrogenase-like predicted oxidoreductase
MQHAHLGRSGVRVSRLCLGTMNFGAWATEAESFAIMDSALEHGINFFDTANVYGGKAGKGSTEEIVGRWFAQGGGRRDRVVLATKVYGDMGPGLQDSRLSAVHVRRACDESLRRLRTDRIDLYQMHHVWRECPWEEIWQAFDVLVAQGKVTYVGSSNFAAWNVVQANEHARRRNALGLVSEQSLYNLLARQVELEVLPACRSEGVGVIPWSPLSSGLLGGVLSGAEVGRRAHPTTQKRLEGARKKIEAFEEFCRQRKESPAAVALGWLLANDAVTAPIIGPRNLAQLDSSLEALEVHLDAQALARLDGIFPGPGGQAPEAYAW